MIAKKEMEMNSLYAEIRESAEYIRAHAPFQPDVGIILGTGLGGLAEDIDIRFSLEYSSIPHFPVSTVESHKGRLIFGSLSGHNVVAMQGRFHYYEGYPMQKIVLPVRVMKLLGINYLLVSNACGSLNREIKAGDLMIIEDHINLLPANPLIGRNIDELGPRFPDMSQPYDRELIRRGRTIALTNNLRAHTGTYAAVPGPNLETPAEYRYLRIIGADVVGMSTIPEIIAARHMGIPCFGISVVTDEGFHEIPDPVTIEMVIAAANAAEPGMTMIMKELIATL